MMETESAYVRGLDMENDRDRGLVRTLSQGRTSTHRARWSGVDDQLRDDIVRALKVAMKRALEKMDQRAINNIARTIAFIDAMNLKQELKFIEWDRLDAGLLTGRTDNRHLHAHVEVAKPEVREAVRTLHRALKAARTDGP